MKLKVFIYALSVVVLQLFSSCIDSKESTTTQQREWKKETIALSNSSVDVNYSATIRGKQDVEIRPQVSGTITSLLVNEGQIVRNGQLLFVIDQVPYKAALNQATANLQAAKAALATAQLNVDTRKKLYEEKVISEYELRTAENTLLSTVAQVAQAEAAEISAKNNLSYTEVRSPSNGVVGNLPYRQGALVNSAIVEPLTTVSDNSEMYVYFSMDENTLLKYVQIYGSIDATIKKISDVKLVLSDGSIYEKNGKIESISGVIDQSTGSVTFRANFPNPDRLLHSGASGNVQLSSIYNDVIVIPQSATIKLQDKYLVYKVVDGKAKSQLIKIASVSNGSQYIVVEGLNVGDVIIADGAGLLREGMDV